MAALVFLLLNRLSKPDITKYHFETKTFKLLRYVLAGVLTTSGIFNLIVVLTSSSDSFTNLLNWLPVIVTVISIAQILWSIKIIQKWSVYYITIICIASVILLWGVGLISTATYNPTYFDHLKHLNVPSIGIKIELLMIISIVIFLIISKKQARGLSIPRTSDGKSINQ
jgi:hypothetical protein